MMGGLIAQSLIAILIPGHCLYDTAYLLLSALRLDNLSSQNCQRLQVLTFVCTVNIAVCSYRRSNCQATGSLSHDRSYLPMKPILRLAKSAFL